MKIELGFSIRTLAKQLIQVTPHPTGFRIKIIFNYIAWIQLCIVDTKLSINRGQHSLCAGNLAARSVSFLRCHTRVLITMANDEQLTPFEVDDAYRWQVSLTKDDAAGQVTYQLRVFFRDELESRAELTGFLNY